MTRSDDAEPADEGLPPHERRRLFALVAGHRITELRRTVELTATQQALFDSLVARRRLGEPLQYLEGTVQFGPIELAIDHRVLIPRPETEYLLELVGDRSSPGVVVDLCTGSGALALAMKRIFPGARVIGTDVSADALEVAAANGVANNLAVEWLQGDLFDALTPDLARMVDLVVANPPYVAEGDWTGLPEDVKWEPRQALVAGPRGTEIIDKVLVGVQHWLAPTGEAWIEVGEDQARDLAKRFSAQVVMDQYGRDRFVRVEARPI